MNKRNPQFELFQRQSLRQFGGSLLKGNAKIARPLSTKHAIHLVLKSHLAQGSRSFLRRRNVGRIEGIVRGLAKAQGLRLYHFVNVGNHLHMVIKLDQRTNLAGRKAFSSFIRAATGLIARHVLGAERRRSRGIKFWQARPFTRIVNWGRDYNQLDCYMTKNAHQARTRHSFADWGFGIIDVGKIVRFETG